MRAACYAIEASLRHLTIRLQASSDMYVSFLPGGSDPGYGGGDREINMLQ